MEIFGILNVTPDSFSDGGRFLNIDAALQHAEELVKAGATVIDVGGESTRPGALPITVEEEILRVKDVVQALTSSGIKVSLDTSKAKVAEMGLGLGVHYVNDVTGGLGDSAMLPLLASTNSDVILMHWRGPSNVMDSLANYDDVVKEVMLELQARLEAAENAGISREKIIIDPGFGFSKNPEHNWQILSQIDTFEELHPRVLVGVSRKRFLKDISNEPDETTADLVTAAISGFCYLWNVWGVRVHNVEMTKQVVETFERIDKATS
ncbi:MAG: dihydropteroate synthase [Actinomycetota bacterium]|jgi:dihydropteroate synthase